MRFLLVDGNYQLHRALRSPVYSNWKTSNGLTTGGVLGTLRMIYPTLRDGEYTGCMVVWDGGNSKHRVELYPEYRNRSHELNEESITYYNLFIEQRSLLSKLLLSLGVDCGRAEGIEGDDIISWVSRNICSGSNNYVDILSDDRDMFQLITPWIRVIRPMVGEIVDFDNFDKYSPNNIQNPTKFLVYKSLIGDSSDGITHPSGIGPVTAKRLLDEMGNINYPMESIEYLRSKLNENDVNLVIRNINLMDLSLVNLSDVQFYIESSYSETHSVEVLSLLEAKSILKNFSYWVIPFRKLHPLKEYL